MLWAPGLRGVSKVTGVGIDSGCGLLEGWQLLIQWRSFAPKLLTIGESLAGRHAQLSYNRLVVYVEF